MNSKVNLKSLMNHGRWGNSFINGIPPIHVELALKQVFEQVLSERLPGAWNYYEYEWKCYDANGTLRLKVQYGWNYSGWVYQPVAVRKRLVPIRSGDVVYQADGGYLKAA